MKKVGIVGGLGPASTLDYYSGIINGCRAKTRDNNYPELVINSINMTEMLSYVSAGNRDALEDMLLRAIGNLERSGAEFAAIASNTPHIVFDRLQEHSSLPLISIVEETCKYARSQKYKRVAVIGTRFTMGSGLYSEALEKYGVSTIVPPENEQTEIHGMIFPKLENGIVVPEDKQRMLAIVNRLVAEQNADALILGCTELPLMIKDGDLEPAILNTTKIHIDAIVNSIL